MGIAKGKMALGGVAVLVAMALTPALASQLYVSLAALVVALGAYALLARQRGPRREAFSDPSGEKASPRTTNSRP